jgi:hypothetical protein
MVEAQQDRLAGCRDARVPRRVHFITDADCGYTLAPLRRAPGSGILYAELHQRPTDEQRQRSLPAIAIMRTADELPAAGRSFSPEIVSDAIRGTAVLHTGRVEIVWEDPPSHLVDESVRRQMDALLCGTLPASDRDHLKETLTPVVAEAAARIEHGRTPDHEEGPDWAGAVDDDLAGVPPLWIEDLAAARQVLVEIAAARAGDD